MDCNLGLATLECNKTGVGYTAAPISSDSNRLRLIKGHVKQFPRIKNGQYFYIKIYGCGECCETAKVIGIEQDTLVLDRTIGSKCDCIQSNAQVRYDWNNIHVLLDVARSVGLNVLSPLKYDACTRTLSVDCKELFASDCGGCGCEDKAPAASNEVISPRMMLETHSTEYVGIPELRGEKGDKGDQGVGVKSFSISASGKLLYTLSDSTSGTAGTLPVAPGPRGEQGERGPRGEQGEKGDTGATVIGGVIQDNTLVFTKSDNTTFSIDATPLKGEQGEQGEQGEKGDTGATYQYVEVDTKAYVFGKPSTNIYITLDGMPDVTFGPYTTGSDGLASFSKPPLSGKTLVRIFEDSKLVGIGSAG